MFRLCLLVGSVSSSYPPAPHDVGVMHPFVGRLFPFCFRGSYRGEGKHKLSSLAFWRKVKTVMPSPFFV
uniref:Putative secreted protein n=1 Tax=Anopheles darlingi TaxID=43151 RepID=A0A2M4DCA1_ANODA